MERNTTNEAPHKSYLTFKLGEEEFGVQVNQVLNILEMTRITSVPQAPYYMKGVINLRGMVLPVIDTGLKLDLPERAIQKNTCIVVMEIGLEGDNIHIGAIVDEVLSVTEINDIAVEPPPGIGGQYQSKFITGMARINEKFIMLLDMNKIFSVADISSISTSKNDENQLVEQ